MAVNINNRFVAEPGIDSVSLLRAKEIELEQQLLELEAAATSLLAADPEVITGVWSFTNGLTAEGGGSKEWNVMSYFLGA